MSLQRSPKQLAKFIEYILGRRPDEFGLVLDPDGFVKIKELLKAVNEEDGYGYVRRAHLNEIMLTVPDQNFEIADNVIRSQKRDQLPQAGYAMNPPKLLYVCIRQKAHPHVHQKGIRPGAHPQVVLSSTPEMAQRIGERIDPAPVLLTVQVQTAIDRGVVFFQTGDILYLADFIPSDCFSGPPLPKEKPDLKKPERDKTRRQPEPAGSYFIEAKDHLELTVPKSKRGDPAADGGKPGKRGKKFKRKRERPPWRR